MHILLLQQQLQWKLTTATLYEARQDGDITSPTSAPLSSALLKPQSEIVTEEERELYRMAVICEKISLERIYSSYGRTIFRKAADFWEKAPHNVKSHVETMVSKYLVELFCLAAKHHVKVFCRREPGELLTDRCRLLLNLEETLVPLMSFRKGDDGIDYTLKLQRSGNIVTPCRNTVQILSTQPPLLRLGNIIYCLPDGFNAKILTPFASKESIHIPVHMENEYFRKFIIPQASKADIHAEGFVIEEEQVDRYCRLSVESAFNGSAVIDVQFLYGPCIFYHDDIQKARISMSVKDDHVVLSRILRNQQWEHDCLSRLSAVEPQWPKESSGVLKHSFFFQSKEAAVDWLRKHQQELVQYEDFSVEQFFSHLYSTSEYQVQESAEWTDDWLNINVALRLADGTNIPFTYFSKAIKEGLHEIALPNGEIFIIPREWFSTYGSMVMFGAETGKGRIRLHHTQVPSTPFCDVPRTSKTDVSPCPPADINGGALRSYQQVGYEWLWKNYAINNGCCLADDMGLGKTVQTIALLNAALPDDGQTEGQGRTPSAVGKRKKKKKEVGMLDFFANDKAFADMASATEPVVEQMLQDARRKALIVCPTSLIFNWEKELKHFAPKLSVLRYRGTTGERNTMRSMLNRYDVIIGAYRTISNDIAKLKDEYFDIVVFDESQNFKNSGTILYQSICQLQAGWKLALSGTPMENSLKELWSLMHIIRPELLGSLSEFSLNFGRPIEKYFESERSTMLQNIIRPYFMRRTKEEVLNDLPARQDEMVVCTMTEAQQQAYEEELSMARNMVMNIGDEEGGAAGSNTISVLRSITRLRQTANHPALVREYHHDNGEIDAMESGKIAAVFEKLQGLHGTSHKVLLFSEYVSVLNIVALEMDKRGWRYVMLTGSTTDRQTVVEKFSTDDTCQFMLISLKAGGTGLNLVSADYVFMLNPWWNTAAEEQAIDRAHRIGQKRSVMVYKFITEGTLEEKIVMLQNRKQTLIETVMPFLK